MLITGENLIEEGIIENIDHANVRSATYYLSTGAIIPSGGAALSYTKESSVTTLTLKPGEIAWVVSKEILNLSNRNDISGLLTLRSTLTKKGILAIDTGVIDPGWKGPMKTMLINMSRNPVPISLGECFFRVMFFRHDPIPAKFLVSHPTLTYDEFVNERHADIVASYNESFLSANSVTDQVYEKVMEGFATWFIRRYWKRLLLAASLLPIAFLAILFFMFQYYFGDLDFVEAQRLIEVLLEMQKTEATQ